MPLAALNDIKKVIAQPELCSSATVQRLRKLFKIEHLRTKDDTKLPNDRGSKARTTTRDLKRCPAITPGGSKNAKQDNELGIPLSAHEKRVLATQLVNAVLKAHAGHGAYEPSQAQSNIKPEHHASTRSAKRSSTQVPAKLPVQKSGNSSSIYAMLECGIVAFQALISSTPIESHGSKDYDSKLEAGLISFASKLSTLGDHELARSALLAVQERLIQIIAAQSHGEAESQACSTSGPSDDPRPSRPLTNALIFISSPIRSASIACLLLQYQAVSLRLIIRCFEASTNQFDINIFDADSTCAPHLLARVACVSQKHAKMAAAFYEQVLRQLESFAKISACHEDDGVKLASFHYVRAIAFNRINAMESESESPVPHRIWSPFEVTVSTFSKYAGKASTKLYKAAQETFGYLQESMCKLGHDGQVPPQLFSHLSRLANAASCHDDAISWTKIYCGALEESSSPSLQTAAARARLANLLLLKDPLSGKTVQAILQARALLTEELQGIALDCNKLLGELSCLRSSIASTLRARKNEIDHDEWFRCGSDILTSMARLYVKFNILRSGTHPQITAANAQFQSNRTAVEEAQALIDTMISMMNSTLGTSYSDWPWLVQSLQACIDLSHALRNDSEESARAKYTFQERTCLRLSEICWTFYIGSKETASDEHRQQCLQHCCAALHGLRLEIKDAGSLPFKLHRLGRHSRILGDISRAYEALEECLGLSVRLGCFEDVGRNLSCSPVNALNALQGTKVFFSALKTFIDIHIEKQSHVIEESYLDGIELDVDVHAALLEWQLHYLNNVRERSSSTERCRCEVTRRCLQFYAEDQKPLSRTRLLICYLRYSQLDQTCDEHLAILNAAEHVANMNVSPSECDQSPAQTADHLRAQLSLVIGTQSAEKRRMLFEAGLRLWQKQFQPGNDLSPVIRLVDSADQLREDLELLSRYMQMMGDPAQTLAAQALQIRVAHASLGPTHAMTLCLMFRYAFCLFQLGSLESAKNLSAALRNVQAPFRQLRVVQNQHILAKALESLESDDYEQCLIILKSYIRDPRSADPVASPTSINMSGLSNLSILEHEADRQDLEAQLALRTGKPHIAFTIAKRSLREIQRAWKKLQSRHQPRELAQPDSDEDARALIVDLTNLHLNEDHSIQSFDATVKPAINTPFWPLAPLLFRAAFRLSEISKHCGLRLETFAAEQEALKLAQALRSPLLIAHTQARMADSESQAYESQTSGKTFAEVKEVQLHLPPSQMLAENHMMFGDDFQRRRQWQAATEAYHAAQETAVHATSVSSFERLDRILKALKTTNSDGLVPAKTTSKNGCKKGAKRKLAEMKQGNSVSSNADTIQRQPSSTQHHVWPSLSEKITSKTAVCLSRLHRNDEAMKTSSERMATGSVARNHSLETLLAWADILVRRGFGVLVKDAVMSMLSESTTVFPALKPCLNSNCNAEPRSEELSLARVVLDSSEIKRSLAQKDTESATVLIQAAQLAAYVHERAHHFLDNKLRTQVWSILTSALTALCLPRLAVQPSLDRSRTTASYLEEYRNAVVCQERRLLAADSESRRDGNTSHLLRIDELTPEPSDRPCLDNFMELLPNSWTVLSLAMSEDTEHFHLVRYRNNECPFVLRIPLTRQHPDDVGSDDEEALSFALVQSTMRSIIAASDETVRDTHRAFQTISNRADRHTWWEKREHLDEELHRLLVTVEDNWFGGFRGILQPGKLDGKLIVDFQKAFDSILSRHLPSRQRRKANERVHQFDQRIPEVFMSTANCDTDLDVLENDLSDLLYFVVDTLLFHDEPNAYDEIDFDSMLVEVKDALRSFHRSVDNGSRDQGDSHLVLVLDKSLHSFPWESLPSLQGQSVSRMPSILEIRDRLMCMQQQQRKTLSIQEGIYVSPAQGTCILNPGKDIPRTENVFNSPLGRLGRERDWTSIIRRVPSEAELETALTPSSTREPPPILLYFGHGSGMQYIRPRCVKALGLQNRQSSPTESGAGSSQEPTDERSATHEADEQIHGGSTCAMPLLFGCSSVQINYCGVFNPYGTPLTYLQAGAPAVLGALWDVTDGDCDIFAQEVLARFGLLDASSFQVEENSQKQLAKLKKRRGGRKDRRDNPESCAPNKTSERNAKLMSISGACARSRNDCFLKYLNGAAMVVYGVPVYLDT